MEVAHGVDISPGPCRGRIASVQLTSSTSRAQAQLLAFETDRVLSSD